MMRLRNNRILKFLLLFTFVGSVLLTPIAATLVPPSHESDLKVQMSVVPLVVYAQEEDDMTLGEFMGDPVGYIGRWLGNLLLLLASRVTWLGGKGLEAATDELVFGMGNWINQEGPGSFGSAIDSIWKTLRDLCNLVFIFGFIYAGISTIIDPDRSETKRFVSRIIIAALLINFSLFFVKVIVDFSNFTAYQIFKSMTVGSGSLSETIMDTLGIVGLFSAPDPSLLAKVSGTGAIGFYAMAALFLIIAGFVFAAAAVLLISRFVNLIYIMIASPVLFAATIFPQTEEHASNMWHSLIKSAFFAPAYLLLTIISIRLLQALPLGVKGGDSFTRALAEAGPAGDKMGFFGIILFFFVAIFFLMSSLTIANKMSIAGSEMVIRRTKTAIGASTAGLLAKGMRATVGWKADQWTEDKDLLNKASKKGAWGMFARARLKTYRAVADAPMDFRNAPVLGKQAEELGIGGSSRKGGYKTTVKEAKESEEKFAKSLGEIDDDDIQVRQRKEEEKHAKELVENHRHHISDYNKERDELLKQLRRAKNEGDTGRIEDLNKKIKEVDSSIEAEKKKLHHAEEHHEEAKIKYEKEKMRRQTGSTFNSPEVEAVIAANEKRISDIEKDERDAWKSYNKAQDKLKEDIKNAKKERGRELTEDEIRIEQEKIAEIRQTIVTHRDRLKAAKTEHESYLVENTDRGYAGALEGPSKNASWVQKGAHIGGSWITGRLARQDKEAGKAIRKARKKGKPKESHDDHGGHGKHDAHDEHHDAGHDTHHKGAHDAAHGGGAHAGGAHH